MSIARAPDICMPLYLKYPAKLKILTEWQQNARRETAVQSGSVLARGMEMDIRPLFDCQVQIDTRGRNIDQ